MALSPWAAAWFLAATAPFCFLVAWNDMRVMKIPNWCTDSMVVLYGITGLIALPFADYLWHWLHFPVVLAAGILLNAARIMGAGDAKFAAAAAPYIALGDLRILLPLFAACLLAGVAAHRLAKHTPLRRLAPDWESWEAGKRFPMGLPLALTLVLYLLFALFPGVFLVENI